MKSLLTLLVTCVLPHAASATTPNVVLIFCDNLGHGDVGCFNPNAHRPTPRIDRMAQEGMKFTHAYSALPHDAGDGWRNGDRRER